MKAGTSNNSQRGVTLLELVVVMFIISVIIVLSYPSFMSLRASPSIEAKRLASVITYLNDTSSNRRQTCILIVDFKKKELRWETSDGIKQTSFKFLNSVLLPSKGEIKEGELQVFFDREGLGELFAAYFTEDKKTVTLIYNPFSRRVSIEQGRVDLTAK
ncbi:type II secretion system protein [Candidatus Magnetomonas plexicatena]|uniref:type II secretion system protein n=1 Tax=Candidatus Magnetomonas plexicatena TaxID=2552947 RepID=UPI001C7901A6|nr:prepilin-type N-terminal cleavage/methylation domain-containing protein [Nitrospirales bacterium LBB_01]